MFNFFGGIINKVLGLFGKKMDNDKAKNDNQTDIKKTEIQSEDHVVRRYKYYIIMICVGLIVSEAFGVRLAILRYFNVDSSLINFEKILNIAIELLSSEFTGNW